MTNADAINEIQRWLDGCPYKDVKEAFNLAIKSLEERQQGEWIDYNNTFYKCPECGYLLEKCCPQCQNKVILPKGCADLRGENNGKEETT